MLPRDDVAVVVRRPNDVHTIYGFCIWRPTKL